MRKVIFAIVIMAVSAAASANQRLIISVGEIKLLRLNPIERVAVGHRGRLRDRAARHGAEAEQEDGARSSHRKRNTNPNP